MRRGGSIQLFPLLRVAVVLILGIAVGDALLGNVALTTWKIATIAALALSFLFRQKPLLQSCLLLLTVFLLGGWLVTNKEADYNLTFSPNKESYEAVIISTPTTHNKVVRCDLLVASGRLKGRKLRATWLKQELEEHHIALKTGVGIVASSVLEKPQNYYSDSHFDYVRWMKVQGYVANTFIPAGRWYSKSVDMSSLSRFQRVKIVALKMRERLMERYRMVNADAQSYAVVAAMTLGDKTALTRDLKEVYSITGASHVLALSGLHLGVIYAILSLLFARRRWELIGQVIIVVAIWSYVLMVGMSPSVLRAATMFSIYAVVSLLRRDRVSLNVLSLTAVVMLCVDPLCLWDVGAQMSFLAVLGILVFYSPIYHSLGDKRLQNSRVLRWFWSMISVSVASQLGVAPLIIYYFGRFSCYFLLTNLIAVPLSTIIIYCAFFMFLTTALPPVSSVLSYALFALANLLNTFLGYIARLPLSSIDDISINKWQLLAIYVFIASVYGLIKKLSAMYKALH